MNWQRHTHPSGLAFYTSEDAPGWVIEADSRLSQHNGMVFGQFVNDADRYPRIVGWDVLLDGRRVNNVRKLADAKRYVERRLSAEWSPAS